MSRADAATPWWTEVPLVAVHLAVAWGFDRLFMGSWAFAPLAVIVLVAHALAIGARRTAAPPALVAVASLLALPVVLAAVALGETTAWGLPTAATWEAAMEAVREARAAFPVVLAPTDPIPGFVLVAGAALWFAAWFGDWAAHRARATIEPVCTAAALFAFVTVLSPGVQQVAATAAFGSAVAAFVAVQRASTLHAEQRWMANRRPLARSLAVGGTVLGLGALGVALAVGPHLPGADADPIFDWRERRGDEARRITVSPMVELQRRLVEQSDDLLFEVRSNEPAYWRLTSLDRFDGEVWSSDGSFRPATRQLPSTAPSAGAATSIDQRIRIRALAAIWVPVAHEAVSLLDASHGLRWDPDSSTLIVDSSRASSDGLTYSVVSRSPTLDPAVLRGAPPDPSEITGRYSGLPVGFPDEARRLAFLATRGAGTRYDQARALQDWFRTEFTYSLEAAPGHGTDALVSFLSDRTGYCEQFAGAFAAMGRALGMPTRVAVGFTPGNPDPRDPQRYLVLGRHAHAWPEVHFAGVGWVPFEPTPGRGMPGAQGHTGVAPEQDLTGAPATPVTTTAPAPTTTVATTAEPSPSRPEESDRTESVAPDRDRGEDAAASTATSGWLWAAPAAVLLAIALLARRRRRRATRAADPVDHAWHEVVEALTALGVRQPGPAETPLEVARRAREHLDDQTATQLAALAELVTAASWAAPGEAEEASAAAVELASELLPRLRSPVPATAV